MANRQGQQKTPQQRDDPPGRGGQGQPRDERRDDELRVEGDPDEDEDDEDMVDAEIELDDEEE